MPTTIISHTRPGVPSYGYRGHWEYGVHDGQDLLRDDSEPVTLKAAIASLRYWRRTERAAAIDDHGDCDPAECEGIESHLREYSLQREWVVRVGGQPFRGEVLYQGEAERRPAGGKS